MSGQTHLARFSAMAIVLLNLLDTVFTIAYVKSGMAIEANPLMDFLLQMGTPVFAAVKLIGVAVGVYFLLWTSTTHRAASAGLVGIAVAYYFLVLYHVSALPV